MEIKVTMRHPVKPFIKYAYIGFSRLTLIFSPIEMARRGQIWKALFYLIICPFLLIMTIFISIVYVKTGTGSGELAIICSPILYLICMMPLARSYNKQHMLWLLKKGYRFADTPELNERAAQYAGVDVERSTFH